MIKCAYVIAKTSNKGCRSLFEVPRLHQRASKKQVANVGRLPGACQLGKSVVWRELRTTLCVENRVIKPESGTSNYPIIKQCLRFIVRMAIGYGYNILAFHKRDIVNGAIERSIQQFQLIRIENLCIICPKVSTVPSIPG